MRISLTGPHGSGKSTLMKAIEEDPRWGKIELQFLPEMTRKIAALGYPINEAGTNDTQNLVIARYLEDVLAKDNYIVDRCIVDGYVYTQYLVETGQCDRALSDYAFFVSEMYIPRYNYIFYIPSEFEIEEDGTRSVGEDFHDRVVELFEEVFTIPRKNVIPLRGTVEERREKFFDTLREGGVI